MEEFLMAQLTGISSSAEYLAKTATRELSPQKSGDSNETEVKSTSDASAAASAATTTDAEYQAILAKANSGQQLTSAELTVLKAKNPAAYARATRTDTARQELTSQMEKSPNLASRVLNEALSSLSTRNDEDSAVLTKALTAEYNNFASKHDQVIISSSD
jgi:hypothetical protein